MAAGQPVEEEKGKGSLPGVAFNASSPGPHPAVREAPELGVLLLKKMGQWLKGQVAQVVENPPGNAGGTEDAGSLPGSERSPRRRHGNPLQDSCLKNPMDRGAWRATVHRISKSQT